MTENLATQFVEENGYPMHVFRSSSFAMHAIPKALWLPVFASCLQNEPLFLYMDMCPPKMIDITSNFSLHQESPVYVDALSFSSVFFAHFIL